MKLRCLFAIGVLLAGVTAAASPTTAEKPAQPQPTEQQKLEERVDALESQLKEAQAKADRAAMEKDYIERIQADAKAFYDKVLTTQTWTLTIVGIVLTAVFGLSARFGLTIFDRHIEQAVSKATADLETKFDQKLADQLQRLRESNTTQLKELEDDLNHRIEKKAAKLENDTKAGLLYSLGLSFVAAQKYTEAIGPMRDALETLAKSPQGFSPKSAQSLVTQMFLAIKLADPQKFADQAKKELAAHADLYKKLENELNATAIDIPDLVSILKERKETPTSTPKP